MASNDDEQRRSTLATSTPPSPDELAGAIESTTLTGEQRPTTIDSLPNDVIVSIFEIISAEAPRWVTSTFPLVCRRWRDLYRSRQASPLHRFLALDVRTASAPIAIAWARRHAEDVRVLVTKPLPPDAVIRDFTGETFGELVSVVRPHLTEMWVLEGCSLLLQDRFWSSLGNNVVPDDKLRALNVKGIRTSLPDSFGKSLGKCPRLETLGLACDVQGSQEGARNTASRIRWGFSGFPESIVALSRLTSLYLRNHRGVASLPSGISKLKALLELEVQNCSLRALPTEMGALSKLELLDASINPGLGVAPDAFPAALRGMEKSLVELRLMSCGLRAVPSFVGSLKSLKMLWLSGNEGLGSAGAPYYGFPASFPRLSALEALLMVNCGLTSVPPAVLSSMPKLRVLSFGNNGLTALPPDFGGSLTSLEVLDLRRTLFASVPVAVLAGATALEKIDISDTETLQVETPIDDLLDKHPRLQIVRLGKRSRNWTPTSLNNIVAFGKKLRLRNPDASRSLLEAPTD